MTHWITYSEKSPKVKLDNLVSKYIIEEFGSCLPLFFSYPTKKRPQRTTLIKDTLTLLGNRELKGKQSYKVYSNGLSQELRQNQGGQYKNNEWLFDLHWYTEAKEPYLPTSLPLVVECEWNHRKRGVSGIPYSGIKYDFQKLLVANAELRLMIFIVKKEIDLIELGKYFDLAIQSYTHLELNSKFLFIAFDESINGFHYAEKLKL